MIFSPTAAINLTLIELTDKDLLTVRDNFLSLLEQRNLTAIDWPNFKDILQLIVISQLVINDSAIHSVT